MVRKLALSIAVSAIVSLAVSYGFYLHRHNTLQNEIERKLWLSQQSAPFSHGVLPKGGGE